MPSRQASRHRRGDVLAVAVLVGLPIVVFGVPALLGHAVLPGDDLTQNYPLRVLAGAQIRRGQLPLYDPYTWSGAPLLGSWNAGAAYPLTALFAVLPGIAAWTAGMVITWTVAGVGLYFFLRALCLGRGGALLGGLSFAFAGAMAAQVAHFGLVAGMSWVPVGLLSVLRLSQPRGVASRLRWTAALAGVTGLTILAAEPRAIDDAAVVLGGYALWRVVRCRRGRGPAALSIAAGLGLGVCLGAVQWLPGLAAVGTSQRGAVTTAMFDSGSLPRKWLLLALVPDLLGGSGSFGQPAFAANYNLAEVTSYVGILPLVAAFALLARLRWGQRLPEWFVWHLMAVAGVLLALGGNSPLGRLLVHVPLFGDQRLQSRNILVADLALAVLLGYWAGRPQGGRRGLAARLLGLVPPLGVLAVVVLGLTGGAGFFHWLGMGPAAGGVPGRLRPWLVPYAVIAVGAIAFVLLGPRLRPAVRTRLLAGLVLTDLVVFTVLGVVAVAPGLGAGHRAAATGTTAARSAAAGSTRSAAAGSASAPRPVAALGYAGRFAIYDPGELDAAQLPVLGAPDLNVISGTPSVQGYSSLVDRRYAALTGSHQATGDGQNVLSPAAVAAGVLDQLDTSVLLTPPAYLVTPVGRPGTGRRTVSPGHPATWYLGMSLEVSAVQLPAVGEPSAAGGAPAGGAPAGAVKLGVVTPTGSTRWFGARVAAGARLAIRLPHPVTGVAVVAEIRRGRAPARFGAPSITDAAGKVFVADGQLQDALTPPRWAYAGHDGAFALFTDRFARAPLRLAALPGRSVAGAVVTRAAGPVTEPTAAAVRSPQGAEVIRAVAAIPGWRATWHPRGGVPVTLPVHRDGLVQSVSVPPGTGVLTWSYVPSGFTGGWWLSAGAGLALVLLLLFGMISPRFPPRAGHRVPSRR